ncbi:glycerophosphodiester phosphodiesterase family protein [Glaciibacter sp. 2TAF33]|uniref:glycerophosphodiester phosphodiesterase family protein n=1 Tax=Glaciibacter sp. 2TAF33 TaxID=3233015 RepID=UPI003F8EB5D6
MPSDAESAFLATSRPRVLAHRGLAVDAPENTLLAFLSALSHGATHLETDVHLSLDGVPVLSHDPDLTRLGGRTVRIDQLTMAELRRIDLGGGQAFASLAEALDAFPDARFNIDVKSDAAPEATAAALIKARAIPRVLVTSFSERRRRRTVDLLPHVATSPSAAVLRSVIPAAALHADSAVRRGLAGFAAVQVPERVRSVRIVTPRFVDAVHAAGVEVHVWTVNEPDAMTRLLDLGVDGLVTDRCDVAAALIAGRG